MWGKLEADFCSFCRGKVLLLLSCWGQKGKWLIYHRGADGGREQGKQCSGWEIFNIHKLLLSYSGRGETVLSGPRRWAVQSCSDRVTPWCNFSVFSRKLLSHSEIQTCRGVVSCVVAVMSAAFCSEISRRKVLKGHQTASDILACGAPKNEQATEIDCSHPVFLLQHKLNYCYHYLKTQVTSCAQHAAQCWFSHIPWRIGWQSAAFWRWFIHSLFLSGKCFFPDF